MIQTILTVVGLMAFVVAIAKWLVVRRVYGRFPWRMGWQMIRLARGSVAFLVIASAIVSVAGLVVNLVAPALLPPYPPVLIFGFAAIALAQAGMPPAVLLLGRSDQSEFDLYNRLTDTTAPYRLVHLLSGPFGPFAAALRHSSLRTVSDGRWRAVVDELAALVPVIVLDARIMTPNLAYEARRVLDSGELCRKTIFVVDAPNLDPVLAAQLRTATHPLVMTSPDMVEIVLRASKEHLKR